MDNVVLEWYPIVPLRNEVPTSKAADSINYSQEAYILSPHFQFCMLSLAQRFCDWFNIGDSGDYTPCIYLAIKALGALQNKPVAQDTAELQSHHQIQLGCIVQFSALHTLDNLLQDGQLEILAPTLRLCTKFAVLENFLAL